MCDQIGPQNREVMSLEKLALKQANAQGWKKQATQVPWCSDRCENGLNKPEGLQTQVYKLLLGGGGK